MTTTFPVPAQTLGTVHDLNDRRTERMVPVSVLSAIDMIAERYPEPLTLNEIAAHVFVSPFHFSRVFAKATGTTPGRYLTAVRLFEAKRLLLTTSMTVSDIVCSVGYSSVGTFTSRFTRSVGLSPSQYRSPEVRHLVLAMGPGFQRFPSPGHLHDAVHERAGARPGAGRITVRVEPGPGMRNLDLVVGAFREAIPQSGPVAFAEVHRTGPTTLTLHDVPPGRWHVLAAAEEERGADGGHAMAFGGLRAPVVVTGDEEVRTRLRIRSRRPTDPPLAFTLASRSQRFPVVPAAQLRAA